MKRFTVPFLTVLLFLFPSTVAAQGLSLSVFGGISKDMRSKTENVWKMGFNAGAQVFVSLPVLTIGGRIAYHSWGADGAGWLKELDPTTNYTVKSEEGSQSLIEIVPSLRFALINPPLLFRIDAQVGVGMFMVSSSTVKVTGTFNSGTSSTTYTITTQSLTGFGPQIGLPISLLGTIEVTPIYSAYTAKGDWYNHWGLSAGFKFGI